MDQIKEFKGEHRWLSNFWLCEFEFSYLGRKLKARSVEHAFQACKTINLDAAILVLSQVSPSAAKREGRALKLRVDWDNIKDKVMGVLLRKKFAIPELKHRLINTGDAVLIEGNWWHDQYWGDCKCPKHASEPGKNVLGELLMQLRTGIREASDGNR